MGELIVDRAYHEAAKQTARRVRTLLRRRYREVFGKKEGRRRFDAFAGQVEKVRASEPATTYIICD